METFLEVTISKEEVKKALNSLETIKGTLNPYLAKLSPEERTKIPRLTSNTVQFIKKSIDYISSSDCFTPNFIDIEELRSDYETIKLLTKIIEPLNQLCSDLNDTILLSGREAYKSSLNYYYSIEEETRINPKAKLIHKELSVNLDKIDE
jgi:hypothetical protein